jgi:hypothetical protein
MSIWNSYVEIRRALQPNFEINLTDYHGTFKAFQPADGNEMDA